MDEFLFWLAIALGGVALVLIGLCIAYDVPFPIRCGSLHRRDD